MAKPANPAKADSNRNTKPHADAAATRSSKRRRRIVISGVLVLIATTFSFGLDAPNPADASACQATFPNDGWGWNGTTSCKMDESVLDAPSDPGSEATPPKPSVPTRLETPVGLKYSGDANGGTLLWNATTAADSASTHTIYKNGQQLAEIAWTSGVPGSYEIDGEPAVYWIIANAPSGDFPNVSALLRVNTNLFEEEGFPVFDLSGNAGGDPKSAQVMFVANRLRFNSGDEDRSLFHAVTPVRAGLSGSELARYDGLVDRFVSSMKISAKDYSDPGNVMDPSMRYLLAAYTVEAFWNRPDYIEKLHDEVRGRILVYPKSGTSFYRCRSRLFGTPPKLELRGVSISNGPHTTFVHELAHALDCNGKIGHVNGLPVGLTKPQEDTLRKEFARLCYAYKQTGDPGPLDPYAYKNRAEFWAETSSHFLTNRTERNRMKVEAPVLYNTLREVFRMDELPEYEEPSYEYPYSCSHLEKPLDQEPGDAESPGDSD